MPYRTLTYREKGHIAQVTLNRPEAGNAVNLELAGELAELCAEIDQNREIHVVVLGAAGGVFCHGGGAGEAHAAGAIAGLTCPVIAAINGDALGQGLELALACDIRLAAATARFGLPQVAQGLLPTDGGTQRLARIVGRGPALELLLTASAIGAEEALRIGLVNRVMAPEALAAEAMSLAEGIAARGPVALRYVKEAVNQGLDLSLEQGLRLEADLYFLLHTTADRTEGIRAFLEKRPPRFRGE